jgi:ribose transport system permease protein
VSVTATRPAGDAVGDVSDDGRPMWRRLLAVFASEGFIVIFAAWAIYLSIATEQFMTKQNVLLVVRQASIFDIVGIGTTMVVLLGELDISFGSVVSLAGCVGAAWIAGGHHPVVGFALAIGVGLLIGAVNGLLVTFGRIASVVATLGTLGMAAGLAQVYTSGSSIFGDRLARIYSLAQGTIVGIPTLAVIAAALYVVFSFVVARTRFGSHLYAAGDSEVAAYRAGVRVRWVKLSVFVIAGGLAGVAAMLQVARLGRAQSSIGTDFLFPVLTAVILGGVSMHGGKGRLVNTAIASVFLASITNGLILLSIDSQVQQVVQGGVLIAAVSLDRLRD